MPSIAEVRQKYPQYADLSDDQLLKGLHDKYYSDMPYDTFAANFGPHVVRQAPASVVARQTPSNFNPHFLGDAADLVGSGAVGLTRAALSGGAGVLADLTNQDVDKAMEAGKNIVPPYQAGENVSNLQKQIASAAEPITHGLSRTMAGLGSVSPFAADVVGGLGQKAGNVAAVLPGAGAIEDTAGLVRATGRAATSAPAKAADYFSGRTAASKIAKDAAGSNLESIRTAMAAAPKDLTAAQAASGINQDTWQSLGALAAHGDTTSGYRMLEDSQEAARRANLAKNTPDLATAEATRAKASGPLYDQANSVNVKTTPELSDVLARVEPSVLREAERLSREAGNPFSFGDITKQGAPKYIPGDVLHYTKLALDAAAKPGAGVLTGIGSVSPAITGKLASDFAKAVSNANPIYGVARDTFANLSGPVNQAQVMGDLSKTLRNSAGGERVGPFLTAIDKAPESVLKRATGQARFKNIDDILTPRQSSAVSDVAGELSRDAELGRQARAGAGGLSRIMERNKTEVPTFPGFVSPKITVANKVIRMLDLGVSRRTVDKLIEGMRSGSSAADLLKDLTPAQRAAVADFVSTSKATALAGATNLQSEQ